MLKNKTKAPALLTYGFFVFWMIVFILGTQNVHAQNIDTDPECYPTEAVLKILDDNHFKPIPLRNVVDFRAKQLFIKLLDPDGLLFTSKDTAEIMAMTSIARTNVDEQVCRFLEQTEALFLKVLHRADSIVNVCTSEKMIFATSETFSLFDDSLSYASNDAELKSKWKIRMKFYMLSKWSSEYADSSVLKKEYVENFNNHVTKFRSLTGETLRCRIEKLREKCDNDRRFLSNLFLNCLTHAYDPHSDFFDLSDLTLFQAMLSSENMTFGISVEENKHGEIEITSINPNTAFFGSKIADEGDVVLQVKDELGKEVDITCAGAEILNELLMMSNNNVIEMTVRKKNGRVVTFRLPKEKALSDDNQIKSFVLQGDVRIGYIVLPGFYTEFEDEGTPGCARDVADIIVRLKQEKIEGLILDLRYNGGGSLQEAVDLAGIFIDRGPISILEKRNGEVETLRDPNPGTIYDGPLTVMINKGSASASEVLVAAFQDYKRAVITGGCSFGKASGQIILPVYSGRETDITNPLSVKMTIEKIYRLNGETYQGVGIKPDIVFPDYTQFYFIGEKDMDYSLHGGTSTKKANLKNIPSFTFDDIIAKSINRQMSDSDFTDKTTAIEKLQKMVKKKQSVSLAPEKYFEEIRQIDNVIDRAESAKSSSNPDFEVKNDRFTDDFLKFNTNVHTSNTRMRESLKHDIYLRETYKITRDLIYSSKY